MGFGNHVVANVVVAVVGLAIVTVVSDHTILLVAVSGSVKVACFVGWLLLLFEVSFYESVQ